MKSIAAILFFFSTYVLFSQSIKETEDWINNNINYYPVSYGDNPINVVERIEVDKGNLYFYHHWQNDNTNYYSGSWTKVNLKDIISIQYSYDKSPDLDNKWINLVLNFKKGQASVRKTKHNYDSKNQNDYSTVPEQTIITMRLNIDYEKSGMKPRMEKALLHLIRSYGGTATVKKEIF
jgi:hypothetical protein